MPCFGIVTYNWEGIEGMRPLESFVQKVLAGEKRSVARAISLIENEEPGKKDLLQALYPHTGNAYIVGITGSPGAGKSSLVDQLIALLRAQEKRVGILAVDPTSPYTGGALLGDRVRMTRHATDPEVYIRSMGTRGSLGGLARSSKEALRVFDACGCEVILVETVGVGQSELDVIHVADTTCVVLTPGTGDTVQAFKAGIMEIADIFIVNKADLPGANKLVHEVNSMLDLAKHDAAWRPPVIKVVSKDNEGIETVWEIASKHHRFLKESGLWERNREARATEEVLEVARNLLMQALWAQLQGSRQEEKMQLVKDRKLDPYTLAQEMVDQMLKK